MTSRRDFLRTAGLYGAGFLGLRSLVNQPLGAWLQPAGAVGFGELVPDPAAMLHLPKGFSYVAFSATGDEMDDGFLVPGMHDGMAAFAGADGRTLLVRNHEMEADWAARGSPFGPDNERFSRFDRTKIYDAGKGVQPSIGGTTTLVFDTQTQRLERQFLSLVGTERNCAGGPTPWGTWITCEEVNEQPEAHAEQLHGYNFEVKPTDQPGLVEPVPLKAMGRFRHEAVAVDPRSGCIYQTEDLGDGLFYRFVPDVPGQLARGGRLEALKFRDGFSDSRNWSGGPEFPVGRPLPVEWVKLEGVDSPVLDLRKRGAAAGAAVFARGEGAWWGREEGYFAMTNGGRLTTGQIFRYRPSPYEGTPREAEIPGTMELFVEPNNTELISHCDNLTVAPWGDLVVCEDTSGLCRLVGITPRGEFYIMASLAMPERELAGACFSPDGSTLFVNVQRPGFTVAITGPWPKV